MVSRRARIFRILSQSPRAQLRQADAGALFSEFSSLCPRRWTGSSAVLETFCASQVQFEDGTYWAEEGACTWTPAGGWGVVVLENPQPKVLWGGPWDVPTCSYRAALLEHDAGTRLFLGKRTCTAHLQVREKCRVISQQRSFAGSCPTRRPPLSVRETEASSLWRGAASRPRAHFSLARKAARCGSSAIRKSRGQRQLAEWTRFWCEHLLLPLPRGPTQPSHIANTLFPPSLAYCVQRGAMNVPRNN